MPSQAYLKINQATVVKWFPTSQKHLLDLNVHVKYNYISLSKANARMLKDAPRQSIIQHCSIRNVS